MKKLILLSALLIFACSSDDSSDTNDNNNPSNCDVVYLDANGITIKACESANIGDIGTIDGVEYTVVDREMLDQMLLNEEDVTKVCTTRITDLSYMTVNPTNWENYAFTQSFNQDISSWDVSNVTNMTAMFSNAESFNQPIGNWNVSNVTDMSGMFWLNLQPTVIQSNNMTFNQPIGNWDVSNVTSMASMFREASSFNQPIGNWDVGSVTEMGVMFGNASSYNQDLSLWNVEGVLDCWSFSTNTPQWTLPQPNFTNCNPN